MAAAAAFLKKKSYVSTERKTLMHRLMVKKPTFDFTKEEDALLMDLILLDVSSVKIPTELCNLTYLKTLYELRLEAVVEYFARKPSDCSQIPDSDCEEIKLACRRFHYCAKKIIPFLFENKTLLIEKIIEKIYFDCSSYYFGRLPTYIFCGLRQLSQKEILYIKSLSKVYAILFNPNGLLWFLKLACDFQYACLVAPNVVFKKMTNLSLEDFSLLTSSPVTHLKKHSSIQKLYFETQQVMIRVFTATK